MRLRREVARALVGVSSSGPVPFGLRLIDRRHRPGWHAMRGCYHAAPIVVSVAMLQTWLAILEAAIIARAQEVRVERATLEARVAIRRVRRRGALSEPAARWLSDFEVTLLHG